MQSISYNTAKENLADTMKKVCSDHSPVVISRGKAESVVMLSLEDYESIEETLYLLRSPVNARRIEESMGEIEEMIKKKKSGSNE